MNDYQYLQNLGYTRHQIISAIQVALESASDLPPPYFEEDEDFIPHDWVILAVLKGMEK